MTVYIKKSKRLFDKPLELKRLLDTNEHSKKKKVIPYPNRKLIEGII